MAKARFPQSVVSGSGDITIDADAREAAERGGKVSLNADQWKAVEFACTNYVTNLRHEFAHPKTDEIEKVVKSVRVPAQLLLDAIEQVTVSGTTQSAGAAGAHIDAGLPSTLSLASLIGPLGSVVVACEQALEHVADHSEETTFGPRVSAAFPDFLIRVATVYSNAGGRPTAYASEHREENLQRGGPFVDFLFEVWRCLPSEVPRVSLPALGERVFDANDRLKERSGKSLAELAGHTTFR